MGVDSDSRERGGFGFEMPGFIQNWLDWKVIHQCGKFLIKIMLLKIPGEGLGPWHLLLSRDVYACEKQALEALIGGLQQQLTYRDLLRGVM